ncbi:3-oxoacyl-[acyl-carrier-protein] reductase [Dyadobacter sp. CY312]|uniref:3-oxoacyl-[acyl-carrier-protein] reductase n=1 Tax=Dyadobacter sp. CY312 TaxID=2907303 RepID=UPI001F35D61E|nr:3-oxoacyl-[acyl-carrier-protein] reductase [Dyadobacter sp. CY312]MCE7044577.1 3-oxoacyl-[acyl-carrier-protein] reductase [Dyadobacter sp. CY312]
MDLFANQVLLITGGSRGIGKAIVLLFASKGAHVAFTYLNSQDEASSLCDLVKNTYGVQCKAYESDASSFIQSEKLVKEVMDDFGAIDILINNAGVSDDNLLPRMSEKQWDRVMNTNVKSVFNVTRVVVKSVMRNKGGKIINITSIVGINGNLGQSNYATAKAGIIGFTKSIAQELHGRNVNVNAVAPGFIKTDMTSRVSPELTEKYRQATALKRLGSPEDVANVCCFLASNMASYVTGQVIVVDGGIHF